jgi:hypothetical protein
MAPSEISQEALKMAWTMVDTIFPRYRIKPRDRNLLLSLATIIAIDDLGGSGAFRWKGDPPKATILVFQGAAVRLKTASRTGLVIKRSYAEKEVDRAFQICERLFDLYDLEEEARATLLTALPCLGLHALQPFLQWQGEPPFDELA